MRKAGMVLAITGGVTGLASAGWVLFFSGIEEFLAAQGIGRQVDLDLQALLIISIYVIAPPAIGIVGGILAGSKTALGGVFCVIGGILGLPYMLSYLQHGGPFSGYLVTSPFLVFAGVLLLLSSTRARSRG